jgi:biotin carboxylase
VAADLATTGALQGLAADAVPLLADRVALRMALRLHGAAPQPFRSAETLDEARDDAERLGWPVVVGPADAAAPIADVAVTHPEDLSLAFTKAMQHNALPHVLLERRDPDAVHHVALLLLDDGRVARSAMVRTVFAHWPFAVPTGYAFDPTPAPELAAAAAQAAEAAGWRRGGCQVTLESGEGEVRTGDVSPLGDAAVWDVAALAHGWDWRTAALALALGDAPETLGDHPPQGAAAAWVASRSGVVAAIEGLDDAITGEGVHDVVLNVRSGDTLGHVTDGPSRDALGFVLATGPTGEAALERATAARDAIRVLTHTILP